MTGIRLQQEESADLHLTPNRVAGAGGDLVSDDERSVAADSWSIKSDYGSILDDDQRHADAAEALSAAANCRAASDCSSDRMNWTLKVWLPC
ncbi:hypothetical protein POPTR_012G068550v4 [Populus trichocarpa]|uniref:Uncharacterized protein n=1 Tax=Populus trichocarpa TaxID=3694 RepID=A0ACC0S5M6_POPTR|nr:hypothetical protein POPTR_012G068550v4 [Populus trichocarpa]